MGGLGSGRRSGWATTLNDFHAVDLRYLRREGLLIPGYSGSLRWSRCGQETGWIGFLVSQDEITLSYRVRSYGAEDWEDMREPVWLLRTPQPLGGERLWFACPQCGRRCVVLYGGRRFLCRRCVDAPYASQSEGLHDWLLSQAQQIRMRLGGSGSLADFFPQKPRGMHWKTYQRLKNKCENLEQAMWQATALHFRMNIDAIG